MRIATITFLASLALSFSAPLASADLLPPSPLSWWYTKPAQTAMNDALPVGNGRLGALVFGGVEKERLVLNIDSLWTGAERDSNYGQYQKLGDLYLDFQIGPKPIVTCTSGQIASQDAEAIRFSCDGDINTKWCVQMKGEPVIWQVETVLGATPVTSYTLVSGNDLPARDPKSWEFAGSMDGQQWIALDTHQNEPQFPKRRQARKFTFTNTVNYKYYHLTITDTQGDSQVQLAEIMVPGISPEATISTTDYRRELDLGTAIERTSFTRGGVPYTREVFASHPDNVIVVRWSSPNSGAISGKISLVGAHGESTALEANTLSFSGTLSNGQKYGTMARVLNHGGTIKAMGQELQIEGTDDVVVLLDGNTDYIFDYDKRHKSGIDPMPGIATELAAASAKTYEALKSAHLKDYQAIFNRVSVDFGKSTPEQIALPTNQRKVLAAQTTDPELEALFLQYGRYLLIGSSRPGTLPANLQGLWNDSNSPAWFCDYHANINYQMNYWGAETANLAECHEPMFDLNLSLLQPWRENSQKEFALPNGAPLRGWAIRTGINPWGAGTFVWDKTANAWLCLHFWEHYSFSGDKVFLRDKAYPVMKETVQFWEDHLLERTDGKLVVPHGWSPEHGPKEDGVSYNQQIVWDLFDNYVHACDALGVDADYRDKIAGLRDKLLGPQIGSWGQILEWSEEKHDPKNTELDTPNDHHRHTSHLFAVYPGHQISAVKTPDFAKAAKVSLDARGATGDVREWSFAWRTALYARLHDAENAYAMLQNLFLDRNTCLNMFGLHPPLQLDGNFGITGGIIEMLMQSHEEEINLLPALPKAWPTGSFKGLRARGAFEIDATWQDGKLTSATIRSTGGTTAKVRYGEKTASLPMQVGQSLHLNGDLAVVP